MATITKKDLMERIAEDVKEAGSVESFPKLEGRNMIMVVAPVKGGFDDLEDHAKEPAKPVSAPRESAAAAVEPAESTATAESGESTAAAPTTAQPAEQG